MDMNKTICHCHDVDVKQISEAIQNGATTLEEVQEVTEAGMGCGGCVEELSDVVEELLEK